MRGWGRENTSRSLNRWKQIHCKRLGFGCSNSLALLTSYDCLGLVWPLSSVLIVNFNLEYLFLSIPDMEECCY